MCGENQRKIKLFTSEEGSSPRVRGKQLDRLARRGLTRLIPACAGKTAPRFAGRRDEWAHPRVCGENYNPDLHICVQPGSSPRVRGKRNSENARDLSRGLIPACAGKTGTRTRPRPPIWAHPRVCGENLGIESRLRIFCGSSPRVRGKLSETPYRSIGSRLIPACAGKTATKSRSPARCQAHPRVCGENSNLRCLIFVESGSSPRVRGKLHRPTRKGQTPGLIPACAGKTQVRRATDAASAGSSPRVRGKRGAGEFPVAVRGLIPACAGKTQYEVHSPDPAPAHPRVCGENMFRLGTGPTWGGSSPRVRGKRVCRSMRPSGLRLIPACAGKTSL